jgi:hypothetical protein
VPFLCALRGKALALAFLSVSYISKKFFNTFNPVSALFSG